ncbi:tRNA dihydrouridine(20/20a) synthase DusA [Leptospira sp. 96542]|nr:tRNA dihydrouridine(20/20a) synthase DusA [Leptospira sp. 96542]
MVHSSIPSYKVSVAPMMDLTDRHFRYFLRQISKHSLLYTEMVTTGAILKGKDNHRYLDFSPEELPLALQLGGDSPKDLLAAARIGENYGYSEINLNVGCPSDRVQSGSFGACLMKDPDLVAEMVSTLKSKINLPITVKHRIGVNGKESYNDLYNFVNKIKDAGVSRIIVHARIAILEGLSPKENRTIPPLKYSDVYKLKEDFQDLPIIINGGIKTIDEYHKHLKYVDGVMIGRAAYDNPYLFSSVDEEFYSDKANRKSRLEVLETIKTYILNSEVLKTKPSQVLRHILGLYAGIPGAREFRRFLSETMFLRADVNELFDKLYEKIRNIEYYETAV